MKNKILVIGIIILVIGAIVASVGHTGALNESVSDLVDDYDEDENVFESYEEGDRIAVTGEITDKEEVGGLLQDGYSYTIDDVEHESTIAGSFQVVEDLDIGTTVTVYYEVQEEGDTEFLEQDEVYKAPFLMTILGVIILIFGIVVALVGFFIYRKDEDAMDVKDEVPSQQKQEERSSSSSQEN